MLRFKDHRIGDKRLLRLVRKWLKVAVLDEEGNRAPSNRGAAQRAVISPLLANICLHYVLDLWSHSWRKRRATVDIIIVRYAADMVMGFQSQADANRFRKDLDDRLAKYALQLHPKKTKLIRFGRFAMQDSRQFDCVKASTFDFLGFTHYCTVTLTNGRFMVGRKTIKKRTISKLKDIKLSLRRRLYRPIAETGQWLLRVLSGYQNYFGVPCNYGSVNYFFCRVGWYWFRSLRRRSQRHRMTTARFLRIRSYFFPPVRVIHPYPAVRFDAKTQVRSPVR